MRLYAPQAGLPLLPGSRPRNFASAGLGIDRLPTGLTNIMDELPGVVAAVDYGTVRIGVAISDPERRFALPLENYQRRRPEQDAQWFRQLAQERQVKLFVVGLPVHLDGGESQKSREAKRFGEWLAAETGVEVTYYDERYTSVEAERLLEQAGLTSQRRKARRDMLAAQILLSAFLESGGRGSDDPGSLADPR